MISRCGLPTRVPDARARAELVGAARPLRRSQGRRDPRPASRSRRAAPTPPSLEADLGRPRPAQRVEQTAAPAGAPAAAGVTENPAALARPPGRSPLDLSAAATRSSARRATDPGAGAADGPGEPDMGLPTYPRRVDRTRPTDRRLHRLEDPEGGGHRPRPTTFRADLATVPGRAGPRDPRHRLRPRRHHLPAPRLRPGGDRARPSPRTPRRDYRPPHRQLGHPAGRNILMNLGDRAEQFR